MKNIILISVFLLSGCGYNWVNKKDLEYLKIGNQGLGYMRCLSDQDEKLFLEEKARRAAEKTDKKYSEEINGLILLKPINLTPETKKKIEEILKEK